MHIANAEWLRDEIASGSFTAKMVFNAHGALLFPAAEQHRDMKGPGLSYEDDYKGNALAAMLTPGRVEIRFHRDYSDQSVARILSQLLQQDALAFMAHWQATYQGRPVRLG